MMVNVSANLLVFKFRQEYGIRLFAEIGLGVYRAGGAAPVRRQPHHHLAGACRQRLRRRGLHHAGHAVHAAGAATRKYVGQMLVVGMSLSMLATPLAWLLSPGLLDHGEWQNLYLFEAGLALCSFAAIVVLKLPPGIQIKVFEPADFLTFALIAPGLALLVIVLNQGFVRWWFNTPWLGWTLAASVMLITTGLCLEHQRRNRCCRCAG